MARRSRRRRLGGMDDGASDIAFLVLFLLLITLVNIREGDPSAPRLMATAPIFRVTGQAPPKAQSKQSWWHVRVFEGGLDKSGEELGCEPIKERVAEGAPGVITAQLYEVVEGGSPEKRQLYGLHCHTAGKLDDRLASTDGAFVDELSRFLGQALGESEATLVVIEPHYLLPFQLVSELGEALRLAKPERLSSLTVRYRGLPRKR